MATRLDEQRVPVQGPDQSLLAGDEEVIESPFERWQRWAEAFLHLEERQEVPKAKPTF